MLIGDDFLSCSISLVLGGIVKMKPAARKKIITDEHSGRILVDAL